MLKKALEDHNNIMPCLIHSLFVSEKTNITFIYEACSENLAVKGELWGRTFLHNTYILLCFCRMCVFIAGT